MPVECPFQRAFDAALWCATDAQMARSQARTTEPDTTQASQFIGAWHDNLAGAINEAAHAVSSIADYFLTAPAVTFAGLTAGCFHEVAAQLARDTFKALRRGIVIGSQGMVRGGQADERRWQFVFKAVCKELMALPTFSLEELENLLRREQRAAAAESTKRNAGQRPSTSPANRPLSPTKKRILSLCRRKALPATAISRKLELSTDHTRRVLAQLVKAGHLRNGPDGYRTLRAT